MFKRNLIFASVGFFLLALLIVPSITNTPFSLSGVTKKASSVNLTAAEFVITTNGADIIAGTPIILKAADLPLPYSKLQTAIVYDGTSPLTTQNDDLDGDGIVDEIVFQLASTLSDPSSKTFTVKVMDEGITNGQAVTTAITMERGLYNETYADWLPAKHTA
ncbi:MAG: DUF4861 family protein, partial [Candidatus Hodarchaeota archaeon]